MRSKNAKAKPPTAPIPERGLVDYSEALKRIAACAKEDSSTLNLDRLSALVIPAELFQLRGLKKLSIEHSHITDTDAAKIGQLRDLEELYLRDCRITDAGAASIAKLSKLRTLRLSQNRLTDVGAGHLARLEHLRSLALAYNAIGAVGARKICRLKKLEDLDLSNNRLGDRGVQHIAALRSLTSLRIWANGIGDSGVTALASLPLRTLDLSHNRVSDQSMLTLGAMINLRWLSLMSNPITDIGAARLSTLAKLEHLSLGGTGINNGSLAVVSQFARLRYLDLRDTRISNASAENLGKLSALEHIIISGTAITSLDFLSSTQQLKSIGANQLQLTKSYADLWGRPGLSEVFLHGARLPDIPGEALSKRHDENCLPRLRAYFAARAAAGEPKSQILRDVKVMLLGNGRVGKTQARRRLQGHPFQEQSDSTHGVEIFTIPLKTGADDEPIPLRVWDFGGQDIYLGTHALFMKTRAVFPIFWAPENEKPEHEHAGYMFRNYPLREWLRFVRELSLQDPVSGKSKSPIILVRTRCDDGGDAALPLNAEDLDGFSIPPVQLAYSAKDNHPQNGLRSALASAALELSRQGPVILPGSWADVKAALEGRANAGQKMFTLDEFKGVCRKHGAEGGHLELLDLLHEFGAVFYDPAVAPDLIILDQNWALQAIYAVFDRSKGAYETLKNGANRGRFRAIDLDRMVWARDGHDEAAQRAFLAMMLSCRVAFLLRDHDPMFGESLYVAPDLLPSREQIDDELPAHFDLMAAEIKNRFVDLGFAPPNFVRALIAHWGAQAGLHGLYWRDGLAFFDLATRTRAMLQVHRTNSEAWSGTVNISAYGADPEALLDRIAGEIATIAETTGAGLLLHTGVTQKARTDMTLDGDDGSPAVLPGPSPLTRERCFVSYAHQPSGEAADRGETRAAFFNATLARLDELELDAFVDRKSTRNGESISRFMKEGSRSPKIVVLICEKYLKSEFCMNELWWIWQACQSDPNVFISRVRAICLPDAAIDTPAQQEAVCAIWESRREELATIIQGRLEKKNLVPDSFYHTQNLAINLVQHAPTILGTLADTIHIRRIEDIPTLRFSS